MPKMNKPSLTNRGPAGLYGKLPASVKRAEEGASNVRVPVDVKTLEVKKDNIRCPGEVLDITLLVPDPMNARLHPERNMEAIKQSLCYYGQTKPIVVRKQSMVVVAGNGTLQAAKALGWSKVACNLIEMSEVEAAGYGLADNRTSELAKWDFEIVAKIDKLCQELGHGMVGWSIDELTVLRAEDWEEPAEGEEDEEGPAYQEGDAELLLKLKVTIEEPRSKVEMGQIYKVGKHLLVIADVIKQADAWKVLLEDGWLFAPYPGPLVPLTLEAEDKPILMVQPDTYIAGHILDHWKSLYGESEVSLA